MISAFDLHLLQQDAELNRLYHSLSKIGFIFITNHGISQDLIDGMFNEAAHFFSQPKSTKTKFAYSSLENTGWMDLYQERLNTEQNIQDLKEAINFNKSCSRIPPEFTANLPKFLRSCHDLCLSLLVAFAKCLKLPSDFFSTKHRFDQPSGDILRFLYYPPVDANVIRAGGHSDYGSLTLLFRKPDDPGGLQVYSQDNFIDVENIPNAILVNTGDLMEYWTRSTFCSTIHRVISREKQVHPRYSIAYFCHAEDDTLLDPVDSDMLSHEERQRISKEFDSSTKYKTRVTTAKEHLKTRLLNSRK